MRQGVPGRPMRAAACAAGLLLAAAAAPLQALDAEWGGLSLSLQNRVSFGAAWRLGDRDDDLVGKLNLAGQQDLCERDDCLSFRDANTAPNQRLLDARGAFLGQVADDGNLNYDQGEVVAATAKLRFDLRADWNAWQLRLRALTFFDAVNADAEDRHANTLYQPAETARPPAVDEQTGRDFALYEAAISREFDFDGRRVKLALGRQTVRWGESTFVALNTLSEINPPNANRQYLPGGEINEIFEPVGLALVSADLFENASVEAFYQYEWRRAQPAAAGSFFSDVEVPAGAEYFMIGLGQFPEDPQAQNTISGVPSLISSSTSRGRILGRDYARPSDGGQYGLRLDYFADNLNGGTELSLYAMNYHSRLPYFSVIAAQDSCARESLSFADAALDCRGFNGTLNPTGLGLEPVPLDTLQAFLDYPENLHLFGFSFNTPLLGWSLAGEYAFRPNLPVQVAVTDVVYAGLQPAFPRRDLVLGVPQLAEIATLPAARRFVPDFLSVYRGIDIGGGERIAGYERLDVGQVDFTAIKLLSGDNPLRADQIQFIAEAAATQVLGMPGRDRLQFEGGVWHENTHASPGADGSGGSADSIRLNPTQQTGHFADDFAWGYRLSARLEYHDVFAGIGLIPTLGFFHDVSGISPYPMQNFVEGRLQYLVGGELVYRSLSATLLYHAFDGRNNTLRDRDYVGASLAYSF